MSQINWGKMTLLTTGLLGLGYVVMRTTTPTPEQTYQAMSPDLRKKVDANRAARLAREAATEQQASAQLSDPDAQKPVWAESQRR